ncbi:MAG: CCA tRNA nucleotidyltransferase [Chloroflexi bacterium]|nr:CCA tRNA nucleotidyltransferase [Chloroflexota bacterium]
MLNKLADCCASLGGDTYLVGGFVRDWLLYNKPGHDIDIAVSGDPAVIAQGIADKFGGTVIPLGAAHGVIRVVTSGMGDANQTETDQGWAGHEASEQDQAPWTIDVDGYSGTIEEDLQRRDFTVNAMAIRLEDWPAMDKVIDPLGGRADLAQKSISALGPTVFQDDPGRLLRAVRLAGQLKFRINPDTSKLIAANASLLANVSPERVREEFLNILSLDGAKAQLEVLDHFGLFEQVIPELQTAKGVDQPNMHYWDVWGHTMHTVEFAELITKGHQNSPIYSCVPWTPESKAHFGQHATDGHTRATVLKLAALFHDIAKPQTKFEDETGRTRFFGHSEEGAEIAASRLGHLRVSSKGIEMVSKMVEQHLRPTGMKDGDEWPTNRAIHRYFRDVGDVAIDTLFLCMADYLGAKGPNLVHEEWLNHARMVGHILHVGTSEPVSPTTARLITGKDLMTHFKIQPGPEIGAVLERVEEARAAGEIETKEQALEMAANALRYLAEQIAPESRHNGSK